MDLLKWHIVISASLGFFLDLLIGDPENFPHPVRLMGKLITFLERHLRKETDHPSVQRRKGALLAGLVLVITGGTTAGILLASYRIHPILGLVLESICACCCLAARNLQDAANSVRKPLEGGDVEGARKAVSMIVGRDTSVLDRDGITRAAVETVAENTADGEIAPLFYLFLFGGVGAMVYKAINTMDSMLGYKNETYRWFGTAAAKLDDAAGFLPARLSGLFIIVSAFLLRYDGKNAWRIFRRDRFSHASPNSAQSESACAGALRLRLAGDAVYFGKTVKKPWIGDLIRPIETEDIRRAVRLMWGASILMFAVLLAVRILVKLLIG